jgi:hypothetical protein
MSGMLGAIAIASVRSARQAEGSWAGASGSAPGFSPFVCVSSAGGGASLLAGGASAGRGLGKGTAAIFDRETAAAVFGRETAAAGSAFQKQMTAKAAVTMADGRPRVRRQGHLRRAFPALRFVINPHKNRGKRSNISGGTPVCLG